jgi:spore maturation protein CgeB
MKDFFPVHAGGTLVDIGLHTAQRDLFMLGSGGAERELAMLRELDRFPAALPVLLGAGMGHAIAALLRLLPPDAPFAVADKEADLQALTGVRKRFPDPRILWIDSPQSEQAVTGLTRWQMLHGGRALLPVPHPFYMRLDDAWYKTLLHALRASARADFWSKAAKPRFTGAAARVLLITSKYFLVGEMVEACRRLGYPHRLLTLEDEQIAGRAFVEHLLRAVIDFHPDCVLTMNHLGVDREGILSDMLARLRLPLGSWFVDNPHLILHLYDKLVSPWTTIFTWDADNLSSVRELGFEHVFYLPLATDVTRFRPPDRGSRPSLPAWRSRVSFVGNSMVYKVALRMKAVRPPPALILGYRRLAAAFGASDERSVRRFLLEHPATPPAVTRAYLALPDDEARLAYEAMLTWEATRQYRAACVAALLPLRPLIVGDRGWRINFSRHPDASWRLHPELAYYTDLPRFYPWSEVNFNCTSKQMKGAVNQRLFDVPATGAFLITDWRDQLDRLFEPGREVVCYREPEEAADLVRYYLAHPGGRRTIAAAARKRVLAEHTWDHRLRFMIAKLKEIYGS